MAANASVNDAFHTLLVAGGAVLAIWFRAWISSYYRRKERDQSEEEESPPPAHNHKSIGAAASRGASHQGKRGR